MPENEQNIPYGIPATIGEHDTIFLLNTLPDANPEAIAAITAEWVKLYIHGGPSFAFDRQDFSTRLPRRLGFVSGDFKRHPVTYFITSVLMALAQQGYEIYLYDNTPQPDGVTQRLQQMFSRWRSIAGLSDNAAAQRIYDDKIDVLFDLSGHTAYNRLKMFQLKPAPLQVTWLGYFNTTGLAAMDYILCDETVLPASSEHLYSETPLRMPEGYLCYTVLYPSLPAAAMAPCMEKGYVTFGCFNKTIKLNDAVLDCWSVILKSLPSSRLLLTSEMVEDTVATAQFLSRFEARGIAASRIEIRGKTSHKELLLRYHDVDIALDTFPYSGGTTTAEALWMSVPVISWPQTTFVSRVSASILRYAGFPELVVASEEEYIRKAIALGNDLLKIAEYHQKLRDQFTRSPLCNAERFAKHLMDRLNAAWKERYHQSV